MLFLNLYQEIWIPRWGILFESNRHVDVIVFCLNPLYSFLYMFARCLRTIIWIFCSCVRFFTSKTVPPPKFNSVVARIHSASFPPQCWLGVPFGPSLFWRLYSEFHSLINISCPSVNTLVLLDFTSRIQTLLHDFSPNCIRPCDI